MTEKSKNIELEMDYLFSTKEAKDILIEIRKMTGMNRKEYAEYFQIPYRTMQDWERGERQMPGYLLRLIYYKTCMELIPERGKNEGN